MSEMKCPTCGAPIEEGSDTCKYCGSSLKYVKKEAEKSSGKIDMDVTLQNTLKMYSMPEKEAPTTATEQVSHESIEKQLLPKRSKVAAGVLAIFLGGLGIHKFYLGHIALGIIYLLFCWTYIPSILGFIEGIIYLASDDQKFAAKHGIRLQ